MMKNTLFPLGIAVLIVLSTLQGCAEKQKRPADEKRLEERVFVVDLVKDEQKMNVYLAHHRQVWPEVEAGFRKAGYKKISLYRYGHLLVMTIMVPEHANLDSMGRVAESFDKRCTEWNKMMSAYQTGVEGTRPGQTWVEAQRFYNFTN